MSMEEPTMVFSSGDREIRVNFGVITGREVTAAEVDELARELSARVDTFSIVSEQRYEFSGDGRGRRPPGEDRGREPDRRRAPRPSGRDRRAVGRRLRGGAHAAAPNRLSDNARVQVREATRDDWEDVKELLAELGRPDVRDDPDEPQHRARFEQYLARDDALALVAEHDGAVVGFVDVEFRQRLNFLQPEAWVPDLVVAEAARGTGAGRALLEEVERRAIERDTWGMALESANWRESSHAFYEHVGWSDVAKAFSRTFGGVEWPPPKR